MVMLRRRDFPPKRRIFPGKRRRGLICNAKKIQLLQISLPVIIVRKAKNREVQAMNRRLLAYIAVLMMVATWAVAGNKMFQLSLTPDIAIYDRSETIQGATLGIWSENPQRAFAFGFVNGATGKSIGFSLGLFNYADDYLGAQFSVVNSTKTALLGWQLGALNMVPGSMTGLQSGLVNSAGHLKMGLQLGIINVADTAEKGGQIGLVNIMRENKVWFTGVPRELAPAMVLVDWRF